MSVKVTFVYPFDPVGPKVGGVETFIRGFIAQAPADFEIALWGTTSSPAARPVRRWISLDVAGRPFRFYPVFHKANENRKSLIPLSLRFTADLWRKMPARSEGVFLFNRLEPACAFLNQRVSKVGFIHNDIRKQTAKESEYTWRHAPGLYFSLEQRILRTFSHIYTVNGNTLAFYRERYPELVSRMSFLPTWVDTSLFHPATTPKGFLRKALAKELGLPVDERWVLFVGRLQEQKAPLRLVESFHAYTQINPRAQLLVVGDGNLKRAMVEKVHSLSLAQRVHFLGIKPQRELADLYRASDVLLLTSHFEGMPRSCLEALGSGLPVVSTDVGEVRRVVLNGVTGEVVSPYSAQAIARALQRVLTNGSLYAPAECVEAVSSYRAGDVLREVYDLCRRLTEGIAAPSAGGRSNRSQPSEVTGGAFS